jgi:hypothetical protein
VDEEEDDFDMDWLDEIGAEAAQETAAGAVDEAPIEEAAPTDETPSDDWLSEMDAAEEAAPEPALPVDEEEDDFDMDWLGEIGTETAQEATADIVDEVPIEETAPAEDEVAEIPDTEIQPEPAVEPAEEPHDDWFAEIEAEDDLDYGESISDTDAWLLSMEQEEEPAVQPEEPAEEVRDSDEWLSTLGIQPDEDQQVSDQQTPESTMPPTEEVVQPTTSDEWLPESEVEPVPKPEPKVDPLAEDLAAARQSVQENDLPGALKTYARIIKKGKLMEEIIQDLNDALIRHPINANLWQILGDAHLRVDNLQEALDAYSKAEDLLR